MQLFKQTGSTGLTGYKNNVVISLFIFFCNRNDPQQLLFMSWNIENVCEPVECTSGQLSKNLQMF